MLARHLNLKQLKNHKLKTLVKHFELTVFKHHDATEDALACAKVFMKLQEHQPEENIKFIEGDVAEFKGIIMGILADDEVNYKEAYELLYWLEDHSEIAERYKNIHLKTKEVLEDDHLDRIEAIEMKKLLYNTLNTL